MLGSLSFTKNDNLDITYWALIEHLMKIRHYDGMTHDFEAEVPVSQRPVSFSSYKYDQPDNKNLRNMECEFTVHNWIK